MSSLLLYMKKENIKNIIIIVLALAVLILGFCLYKYKVGLDINYYPHKLGESWVEGNYKYTVDKRSGPFYLISGINNTPECANLDTMVDPAPCFGGWSMGKVGEKWSQSSTDSMNCPKLISLGFPREWIENSCSIQ